MAALLLAAVGLRAAPAPAQAPERDQDSAVPSASYTGAALYDRFCVGCHGAKGDGGGPAAPWIYPRPRDFTLAEFKWRSGRGPATDDDLRRAIRYGSPGTLMKAFEPELDAAQIDALVAVVKDFGGDAFDEPPDLVAIGTPPVVDDALLRLGKEMNDRLGCAKCHGPTGKGDGPSAPTLEDNDGLPMPTYDLTAEPLKRPRPFADDPVRDRSIEAIFAGLVTGMPSVAMPAYVDVPEADLWAVSTYYDSIRYRPAPGATPLDLARIPALAIQLDRGDPLAGIGYWPGRGNEIERSILGATIPLQGEPPARLAPAQSSLDAAQCARCHAQQEREWTPTFHAAAGSEGLIAQTMRLMDSGARVESCQRCHAPLAEQLPVLRPGQAGGADSDDRYARNPRFSAELRKQGVSCAACHVRAWKRLGPTLVANSRLLSQPGYPAVADPIYERADFCLPCHQLPPKSSVDGKPLLNTYVEWLDSPYMVRGIECQHCHMPNREHTWKGVHDPDTFRQAVKLEAIAARSARTKAVSVRARLTNVGAGHCVPTTATPTAFLTVDLVDARGARVAGAHAEARIGRAIAYRDGGFRDLGDTRIRPGQSIELARAWKGGRVGEARAARVTVRVVPDDYYIGLYERRLKRDLDPEVRALFRIALDRARGRSYVALERLVPLD